MNWVSLGYQARRDEGEGIKACLIAVAHLRFISGITYWVLPLATEFPHLFNPGVRGEALTKTN